MERPNHFSQPPHRHHRRCHHHHLHHHHHHLHHHHILLRCAIHNQLPVYPNSNLCPNFINPPTQIPQPAVSAPSQYEPFPSSHQTQMLQDDGLEEFEEGEDEEPIFVMTDEWREFFAKSEAKRREAKKLAKKQGNK